VSHLTGISAAVIGAGFIGTVHVGALRRLGVPTPTADAGGGS
jgi:hypothetical protein